jgi:hypothetical protein
VLFGDAYLPPVELIDRGIDRIPNRCADVARRDVGTVFERIDDDGLDIAHEFFLN